MWSGSGHLASCAAQPRLAALRAAARCAACRHGTHCARYTCRRQEALQRRACCALLPVAPRSSRAAPAGLADRRRPPARAEGGGRGRGGEEGPGAAGPPPGAAHVPGRPRRHARRHRRRVQPVPRLHQGAAGGAGLLRASVCVGARRGLCSVCVWAAAGPPSAADNTLKTPCQLLIVGVPHCAPLFRQRFVAPGAAGPAATTSAGRTSNTSALAPRGRFLTRRSGRACRT